MKKFHLAVLTLALSSALISGCAEKKEATEKPKEAASAPAEAIAQKPVEPQSVAAPEEPSAVKEQAREVVKDAEKKAAEVKAAAAEKTVEVKAMAAAKAAEVKTVAAEKAVEVKAVAAAKVAEVKTAAAEKAVEVKAVAAAKAAEVKTVAAEKAVEEKAAAGAAIYKMKCSPCHGPEAKGTTMAPALKGNAWVMAASTADLTGVITNGRIGKAKKYPNFLVDMPASKAMSEGDLSSLAAYLKSLN